MSTPWTDHDAEIARLTDSGLKIAITKTGSGPELTPTDGISVNYTGWLENGKAFDSNVDPKFGHVEPFSIAKGPWPLIQGWKEGLVGMQAGEVRKLWIPAAIGYGSRGAGAAIPPNANLIFEVELVEIL